MVCTNNKLYDLETKVFRIIIDNAKNIKKAFDLSLPGFVNLYNTEEDDMDSSVIKLDEDDEQIDISLYSLSQIMGMNGVKRIHCYAHTLQLVIEYGLKASCILSALKKAHNIASATHQRSDLASRINENNLKVIPLKGDTRWSVYLKFVIY